LANALADLDVVLEDADTTEEQRALTLFDRARIYHALGSRTKAWADLTEAIDNPSLPDRLRFLAELARDDVRPVD
jgi:lipoprotein NlpI